MSHFSGGLLSTSSDCRKVNMEAGECPQQLTISLTCTPLVHAAARRLVSMAGQNLGVGDQDRVVSNSKMSVCVSKFKNTLMFQEWIWARY